MIVFVTQSYLHTFEYTDGYENCAQWKIQLLKLLNWQVQVKRSFYSNEVNLSGITDLQTHKSLYINNINVLFYKKR